jgi:hypothetical protein
MKRYQTRGAPRRVHTVRRKGRLLEYGCVTLYIEIERNIRSKDGRSCRIGLW